MVNRSGKCNYCSFTATRNGDWNLKFAMDDHLRKNHPKEQTVIEANNESVAREILALKQKLKKGWTEIR